MAENKIRTFLAISFGEFFAAELTRLIKSFNAYSRDLRFINPSQAHLTLHFFGSIESDRIDSLNVMLRNLASRFTAFNLNLKKIGAFPNLTKPKVLWVGIDGDLRELGDLKDACDLELVRLGFAIENRDFKPHLTLASVNEDSRMRLEIPSDLENYEYKQKFHVHEIVLYKSETFPTGPVYTIIQKFPLESIS